MQLLNKTYFVNLERTIYFFLSRVSPTSSVMKYSKKQFTSGFTRSVSGRDPKGEIMAVRENAGMLN